METEKNAKPNAAWFKELAKINSSIWAMDHGQPQPAVAVTLHLQNRAFICGAPYRQHVFRGVLNIPDTEVREHLIEAGYVLVAEQFASTNPTKPEKIVRDAAYCSARSAVLISSDEHEVPGNIIHTFKLASVGDEGYEMMVEFAEEFLDVPEVQDTQGVIHVLTKNSYGQGYLFREAGKVGLPLTRENYSPEICELFDRTVYMLSARDVQGRLTILAGEPGTGKTYFIRGLIDAVPNGFFVTLPANLVASISGPELLSSFLDHREDLDQSHSPMILIIEDADECLVRRASDNISEISTLLNMTDGLQGEILDLRIVATTNAKNLEIDGAFRRSGRLNALIEIGRCNTHEHAQSIYRRILGDDTAKMPTILGQKPALCEIYREAEKVKITDFTPEQIEPPKYTGIYTKSRYRKKKSNLRR